jgi:transcriptional regulator with XRE-family HTH domain
MGSDRLPRRDGETVGQRLKRLRLERGLSQRELAAPGVSYAYISRIEAGTRQPSVKALRRLAEKLAVTTEYLEFGRQLAEADERELRLTEAELDLRLGDPASAEHALRGLYEDAVRNADRSNASRARIALALAADDRGEHAAAVAGFKEAFALERPSPLDRHDVFATLGRAYSALGQTDRAVELYRECLDEVARLAPENASLRTRYRIYLSYALSDAGDLHRAEIVLREALEDDTVEDDPHMRIRLHWSLARLAEMEGRSAAALRHARRAITLLEATEDDLHQGRAHVLAAWIMNSAGDARSALGELDKATSLFGRNAPADDVAMLALERSRSAALLGDAGAAEASAREAIRVYGGEYGAIQGSAQCALGAALALRGDLDGASRAYTEGVELLTDHRRWRDASHACRAWGSALRAAGRESEALDVLERASELALKTAPATIDSFD